MNLFAQALLLLLSPTILQLIFGSLAMKKRIRLPFGFISLLCCIGQLLFIFLAIRIIAIDAQNQNVRCGMPQASVFVAGVFFGLILLSTILVQLVIRARINRRKSY